MTEPCTAYHAGLWDAVLAADGAAGAIEARPDASTLRQRAAAEALRGFADGIRSNLLPEPRNAIRDALRAISAEPGDEGAIGCLECAGRLRCRGPRTGTSGVGGKQTPPGRVVLA